MKNFKIEVNPQVEMMNIILYTSKYNEICMDILGFMPMAEIDSKYSMYVKSYFDKFLIHGIYKKIEEIVPNGFFLGRPMEFALAISPDNYINFKYKVSDLLIKLSGGSESLEEIKVLFESFRESTKFEKFFYGVREYYNDSILYLEKCLDKYPFISRLEEFYGDTNASYNFIVSNLCKGNFGINFKESNKINIYTIYSIENINEIVTQDSYQLCNTIFHELSHPIVNIITEKNLNLIFKYKEAYKALILCKSEYCGYSDWEECVNEHIIRAISIHLSKNYFDEGQVSKRAEYDFKLGYRYIYDLLEKLKVYEDNRDKYLSFFQFYPELISVFSRKIF